MVLLLVFYSVFYTAPWSLPHVTRRAPRDSHRPHHGRQERPLVPLSEVAIQVSVATHHNSRIQIRQQLEIVSAASSDTVAGSEGSK